MQFTDKGIAAFNQGQARGIEMTLPAWRGDLRQSGRLLIQASS
ncbi:hypothetical protein X741_27225 [Mesorhizobium sp. LNHC229A00]|nr:hypothetical protein X741_27225 [Mesorhizobium sp. LNHC229A00]